MSDPKMAPMPAVKAEGSGLSGWLPRLQPFVAVLLGLSLGLAVTALAGESPWLVLKVLVQSSVGTAYDLGMTLFYATPLIFTGLSVAIAFQAGLFNIGAEGQLAFGALAAAAMGIAGVAVTVTAKAGKKCCGGRGSGRLAVEGVD